MEMRLGKLEVIKENIKFDRYSNSQELNSDIDAIIDDFWNKDKYLMNDDLFDIDLEELSNLHTDLISKLSEIDKLQVSSYNEELIENNIDMKFVSQNGEDSRSGNKIYIFNKNRDYIFVGDLHSDDSSLKRAIEESDFFESIILKKNRVFIFNGDYVDRGRTHLKIMERILIMKYLFPNHIFLLRGNHDGGKILEDHSIKLPYGIPKEDDVNMYFPKYLENLTLNNKSCQKKLLKIYLDFFDSLAYIAIVSIESETIMAVHGGLPRPDSESEEYYNYINSLKDLTDEKIVDQVKRTMCQNIMWSDPYREGKYRENSGRFHYKQEHIDSFFNRFNVDLLIRGHEEAKNGYWYALKDKVITVFSSGALFSNDRQISNTESWYLEISPKILKIGFAGDREFL